MNWRGVPIMNLAAIERPAVVQPERNAAHPHRGKKKRVVPRYLGNHHDGRQRTANRRRDKPCHSDEREGRRMYADAARKNCFETYADRSTQRAAAHQCGSENAARTSRTDSAGCCDRLEQEEQQKTVKRPMARGTAGNRRRDRTGGSGQ